jgi:hypothetical protein
VPGDERSPAADAPIFYVDSSEIREGKMVELKAAMKDLAAFVQAHEPRLLSYNFFINQATRRMAVVAVHPDSASMEFHLQVAGPAFRKFKDLIDLSTIDVYGRVSDALLAQLRQKARTLGSGTVVVHERQAGFARFGP